jgi:hypothetical protein
MVASFCLWTRAGLCTVRLAHGKHTAFLAMDEREMATVRAYALRMGGASAFAFARTVLRDLLVVHGVRLSCVEYDLEGGFD